jgi:hypothetical protein
MVEPLDGPPTEINYGVDLRLLATVFDIGDGTLIHKSPAEAN